MQVVPKQWSQLLKGVEHSPWSTAILSLGEVPRVEFHFLWSVTFIQEIDQEQADRLLTELNLGVTSTHSLLWQKGRKTYRVQVEKHERDGVDQVILNLENWKDFEGPVSEITFSSNLPPETPSCST